MESREVAAPVLVRQCCSSPTTPCTARNDPFGDGQHQGWPALGMAGFGGVPHAPSDCSLRGEGPMHYSKVENFMASLAMVFHFRALPKRKMHQFHLDSGKEINFTTLPPKRHEISQS